MKFGVNGIAGWALAGLCAGPALGQFDYNMDCVNGFSDQIAFLKDFNAGSPAADLNMDGMVNQADYDLFVSNKVRPNFHVYWMVTSSTHNWNPYMDIDVPVDQYALNRNCRILYEGWFPIMPFDRGVNQVPVNPGIYRMFQGADGSYTTWQLNYNAFLAAYDASIPGVLAASVPLGFTGEVSIDFETISPNYHLAQSFYITDQINGWQSLVKAVNSPNLNTQFMQRFGYTPRQGAQHWNDLSTDEQSDFYETTYNTVAIDFYVRTVTGCKQGRPQATWDVFDMPMAAWEIYTDDRKQSNDQMAPLWAVVDTLAIAGYEEHYTTNDPSSSPCPADVNTAGQNAAFISSQIDEMNRLRAAYGKPGQKVMFFTTWGFAPGAGACSSYQQKLLLPDIAVKQLLNLPRVFGADSVAIWGDLKRPTDHLWWEWTPDDVTPEITARWGPIIKQITCPK